MRRQQHYYIKDHLGSVRVVQNEDGTPEQVSHYYPYGNTFGPHNGNEVNPTLQQYKFNGKELDPVHGLGLYDYGARMYDPLVGRWTSVDPMAEKYYHLSPYAMCGDNPILFVDNDGREVIISGLLSSMAVSQLQTYVGNNIVLSLNEANYLCYSINNKDHLTKFERRVIKYIDDSNVLVNLATTDNNITSTNNLFIGGAFMGNTVKKDVDGNVTNVVANQEVNPYVLEAADEFTRKGTFIMHELSEAYEGATISYKEKRSSPKANEKGSVYKQSHKKATYQPPVYERLLDANGSITTDPFKAKSVEWFVKPYENSNKEKIIQTLGK